MTYVMILEPNYSGPVWAGCQVSRLMCQQQLYVSADYATTRVVISQTILQNFTRIFHSVSYIVFTVTMLFSVLFLLYLL